MGEIPRDRKRSKFIVASYGKFVKIIEMIGDVEHGSVLGMITGVCRFI
jgi:hypothetical protein